MKLKHLLWAVGLFVFTSINGYSQEGEKTVIEDGKKIKIHYTLTVDGKVVDSSEGREPLEYIQGKGQIITGLEKRLEGLNVGDRREVIVGPEDAYGVVDPDAFVEIDKSRLPKGDIQVGTVLQMVRPDGQQLLVTVAEIKDDVVVVNGNHPLAGKELHFAVEVIEIS
ncbi:MAG: peptidylprolyl isomerase [Candidatus Omnitrophica bacterium]|nr:peptidylprolyl isomerase [Candidatus Omnitrophota bacterium]